MRDLDNLFGGYVHIRTFPREAEALHILRKAASCVKPMMRKRGWRVGQLCEFFPQQANLWGLNVNHGETINLRLRQAGDSSQFLRFEQILDTLLHELCHNWIGPHNAEFHKLWEELRDEWTTLQMKGFSGEGFLGKGQAVGGQRVPMHELQRRAHAAAVERSKKPQGYGSGHRLGGVRADRDTDIRNVIADAVQRRNSVTSSCGTGDKAAEQAAQDALLNGYKTKEAMDEANELAIQAALFELMQSEEERKLRGEPIHPISPASEGLTWSPEHGLQAIRPQQSASRPVPAPQAPASAPWPASPPWSYPAQPPPVPLASRPEINPHGRPISRVVREAEAAKSNSKQPMPPSSPPISLPAAAPPSQSSSATWQCAACTLINPAYAIRCEACESAAPMARASAPAPPYSSANGGWAAPPRQTLGWNCTNCGTFMESQWWTCSLCGMVKTQS